MGTLIGDSIGTNIGIHSPIPYEAPGSLLGSGSACKRTPKSRHRVHGYIPESGGWGFFRPKRQRAKGVRRLVGT